MLKRSIARAEQLVGLVLVPDFEVDLESILRLPAIGHNLNILVFRDEHRVIRLRIHNTELRVASVHPGEVFTGGELQVSSGLAVLFTGLNC